MTILDPERTQPVDQLLTAYLQSQRRKSAKTDGLRKIKSNIDFDDLINARIQPNVTQITQLHFTFLLFLFFLRGPKTRDLDQAPYKSIHSGGESERPYVNRSCRTWPPSSLLFQWLSCCVVAVIYPHPLLPPSSLMSLCHQLQSSFLNNAGLMVIGYSIQTTEAKPGMMCPMYCMNATYMTCPPKNTEKLPPACNCCIAENSGKRGCTIYLGDGGAMKCP